MGTQTEQVTELTATLTRQTDGGWLLASPDGLVPSFKERGHLVRDIIPILMSLDLGLSWAEAWLELYKRHPDQREMAGPIAALERLVQLERATHA